MSKVLMVANSTYIMIAMNEPYGICSNVVLNVSNPKPLITSVPTECQWKMRNVICHSQLEVAPLGTLAKNPRRKYRYVFGSLAHSITWSHRS